MLPLTDTSWPWLRSQTAMPELHSGGLTTENNGREQTQLKDVWGCYRCLYTCPGQRVKTDA